jgi:hypothetical protein
MQIADDSVRLQFVSREFIALPVQLGAVEPVVASSEVASGFMSLPFARMVSAPATANVLLRSEVIDAAAALRPGETGDRASFDVPISPQKDVVDTVLFEDAKTPDVRFYLPRYRVRSDGDREVIRFGKQGAAWELALELEAFVPPPLGDVGAAGPLVHTVGVELHYLVGDGQFTHQFAVTDTPEGNKRAVLPLADAREVDVIYGALTERIMRTRLVVRRFVSVAIPADDVIAPLPPVPAPPAPPPPVPVDPGPPPAAQPVIRDHREENVAQPVIRDHRRENPGSGMVRDRRTSEP